MFIIPENIMKNTVVTLTGLLLLSFLTAGCYTQFQPTQSYNTSDWAQERYGDEVLDDYSLSFRDYNRFRQQTQFNMYLGIGNWDMAFSPFLMGSAWSNPYWGHMGGFGYLGFHDWMWFNNSGFFGHPYGFNNFFMADLAFYNGWQWGRFGGLNNGALWGPNGRSFWAGNIIVVEPSYYENRSNPQQGRSSGRTSSYTITSRNYSGSNNDVGIRSRSSRTSEISVPDSRRSTGRGAVRSNSSSNSSPSVSPSSGSRRGSSSSERGSSSGNRGSGRN